MHKWEDWQKEYLISNYGLLTAEDIGKHIGKSKESVKTYAHRNGIKNSKLWTKEEDKYLMERFGQMTNKNICKKLGRENQSVRNRARRLGLGCFTDAKEDFHLTELSYILGIPDYEIQRNEHIKSKKKGKFRIYKEDDVISWMKEFPTEWDATKVDYYTFSRFDWFQEKYKREHEEKRKQRWGKFLEA